MGLARYRTDRIETLANGQAVGYCDWMGGPTISKVFADCPDGLRRWAHVSGVPDAWFSIPAQVANGSAGTVRGWIGCDDGRWAFHPTHYDNTFPIEWRPTREELTRRRRDTIAARQVSYTVELTDTFGGEANYAWVRRESFAVDSTASARSVAMAAKRAIGLTGIRCQTDDNGYFVTIRPAGLCQVAFVTFNG